MDKQQLKSAAEALATAELHCRDLYLSVERYKAALSNCQVRRERKQMTKQLSGLTTQYTLALDEVVRMTRKVDQLRSQNEACAFKHYWWDIPFSPEAMKEPDGFYLHGGFYVEVGELKVEHEGMIQALRHKVNFISSSELAEQLSGNQCLPLFLSKANYQMHINEAMQRTFMYNARHTSLFREINTQIGQASYSPTELWEDYLVASQKNELERTQAIQERNVRWDNQERLSHLSYFTNKERWHMGKMSTMDYIHEDIWRSNDISSQNQRFRARQNELFQEYIRAQTAESERQKQSHKETILETTLLRAIPVGEIIRCGGDMVAILLYTQPQYVYEFDCFPDIIPSELSGRIYSYSNVGTQKPALIPVVRHIAFQYAGELPAYSVLKPCPFAFPDLVWRAWAESQWEQVLRSAKQ